ncbi:MAG: GNAT family N-acetyltransferase, partial [Actinomycetota bacterium]|nr:GNAT family N-acetyltransferase [Actinomycetota bacterium]
PWTNNTIETDSLTLRPPAPQDVDVVLRFLTDPEVRRYLGGPLPEKDARDALAQSSLGERWGSFLIVHSDTDEVIGSVTFDRAHEELEVSYALVPAHWGNGYAAEALRAAITWAWHITDDPEVVAVTQTANEASVRLLATVGMTKVREFEKCGATQAQFSLGRP